MTRAARKLEQFEEGAAELIARHREKAANLERFEPYAGDPVAFAEDVLDQDLTADQEKALSLLADGDRVAWQAAQAVGKSRVIAIAALWWSYARQGQVVISAPTARTVQEVIMRKELARLWRPRPELAGDLYTNSLRIRGDEPAILAYTASTASGATGQHDPEGGVLAILDEAQGVPPEVWVAMDANTTGSRDRQFVTGNPVRAAGDFYEVCQKGSGWAVIETSALDHPNLTPDSDREVPGGPSPDWLERMRDRWGKDSPQWTARVEGQFPEQAEDAAFVPEDIKEAQRRHREGTFDEEARRTRLVLGVDVAGTGVDPDRTALCVRQGPVVRSIETWRGLDTRQSAARVNDEARRLTRELYPVKSVYVDTVGPGGPGVFDQLTDLVSDFRYTWRDGKPSGSLDPGSLREGRIRVHEFKGSRKARDEDRYRSLKAQAFHKLRRMLERGEVTLPDRRDLREELLAHRLRTASDGKMEVGGKEQVQNRLGHSPDLADSLVMTLRPQLASGGGTPAFYGK